MNQTGHLWLCFYAYIESALRGALLPFLGSGRGRRHRPLGAHGPRKGKAGSAQVEHHPTPAQRSRRQPRRHTHQILT